MSEPIRVIIVEDDPDVALFSKTVLEKHDRCVVRTFADPRLVADAVTEFQPDIVLTDIELPGMSGLDLIAQVREIRPGTPVIVMTAHASLDYALTALRSQADEFLTKPVASADLVSHVTRLAEAARAAASQGPQRQVVLAIGAHPDDVEVGVGGILAAHAAAGDSVTILTLSGGSRAGGLQTAWNESTRAAAVIGAEVRLQGIPANTLSSDPLTVETIRKTIAEVDPAIVYVHSKNDHNQDHRAVYDAVLINAGNVRTVACYQGTSATVDFHPNRFVSIDGFTDHKVSMLESYADCGDRPDYLAPGFAVSTARAWSRYGQGSYCEPLEIVRDAGDVVRSTES